MPMIRDRHPVVATTIVNALDNDTASLCLRNGEHWQLVSVRHLGSPRSLNPGARELVGNSEASSRVEREFRRSSVLNRMSGGDRALLRSQSGPVAGVSLVLNPLFTVDTDGARSVQGVASAASCPPVAPCKPYLPVWPSTRRLGPPPCSVREVWGAEKTQSTKEKEGSSDPLLPWDSTTRCRQSMRACGSMSDCLLTWTTSGWWSCGGRARIKIHSGQGQRFLPSNRASRCWGASGSRGFRGRRRFGTSKLPTQGVET